MLSNISILVCILISVIILGMIFAKKEKFTGANVKNIKYRVLRNTDGFWGRGPNGFNWSSRNNVGMLGKGGEKLMGVFQKEADVVAYAQANGILAFTWHGPNCCGVWNNTAWTMGTSGISDIEYQARRFPLNDCHTFISENVKPEPNYSYVNGYNVFYGGKPKEGTVLNGSFSVLGKNFTVNNGVSNEITTLTQAEDFCKALEDKCEGFASRGNFIFYSKLVGDVSNLGEGDGVLYIKDGKKHAPYSSRCPTNRLTAPECPYGTVACQNNPQYCFDPRANTMYSTIFDETKDWCPQTNHGVQNGNQQKIVNDVSLWKRKDGRDAANCPNLPIAEVSCKKSFVCDGTGQQVEAKYGHWSGRNWCKNDWGCCSLYGSEKCRGETWKDVYCKRTRFNPHVQKRHPYTHDSDQGCNEPKKYTTFDCARDGNQIEAKYGHWSKRPWCKNDWGCCRGITSSDQRVNNKVVKYEGQTWRDVYCGTRTDGECNY